MEIRPYDLGRGNWLGLWTLYVREVRRFLKIYTQSLVAPVVTTFLFLAVFALALGRAVEAVGGVPFLEFLAPGLIMMSITQNAFTNTSMSITVAKVQGNIVDTLMPPFTAHELTFALAMGGVTRGICVGIVVGLAISVFIPIGFAHPGFVVFHAVMASLMLSLLGIAAGIWSDRFDHIAAVTNFVVTPLTFLSGTFYSIERLPEVGRTIAHFNPFFYMIDGFRYGIIGHADASPLLGLAVLVLTNALLWWLTHWMFSSGYKLKA